MRAAIAFATFLGVMIMGSALAEPRISPATTPPNASVIDPIAQEKKAIEDARFRAHAGAAMGAAAGSGVEAPESSQPAAAKAGAAAYVQGKEHHKKVCEQQCLPKKPSPFDKPQYLPPCTTSMSPTCQKMREAIDLEFAKVQAEKQAAYKSCMDQCLKA